MSSIEVFACIGVMFVAILIGVFIMVVIVLCRDKLEKYNMRNTRDPHEEISDMIFQFSWWFSEHTPTMSLLQDISNYVYGGTRTRDDIRNTWRKQMEVEHHEDN